MRAGKEGGGRKQTLSGLTQIFRCPASLSVKEVLSFKESFSVSQKGPGGLKRKARKQPAQRNRCHTMTC